MIALALSVSFALGFSSPETFLKPAETGGGGGRLFTGSPTSKWDCSVCHDRDETLTAGIESDPAGLFTTGYEPGRKYRLTISLGVAANGAFGLEATSRGATAAGQFSNLALTELDMTEKCYVGIIEIDPIVVRAGGTSAQSGTCNTGTRTWRVDWTAPASDIGGLTFYLSAVAGNKDSLNTQDREVSRVLGVPAPNGAAVRTTGCGAPAAVLLLPFVGLLLLRRRGSGVAVLLVMLVGGGAWAAAKKKKKTAPAPVTAPVAQPSPEPVAPAPEVSAPEPIPDPEPAAVPAAAESPAPVEDSSGRPLTPALSPPGERGSVEAVPVEKGPAAVDLAAFGGFGYRSLTQYTASFASPLRAALGFPVASLRLRFYPLRLLRAPVLTGLELEGAYQVGWVVGPLPLGAALAIPADGRLAIGYRIVAGPLSIAPRFVYRTEVGGVERNAVFDDPFYQSVGGDLSIGVQAGGFFLELNAGAGKVLDTGTLSTKGYGRLVTGVTVSGSGQVGWRFGKSGIALSARYGYSFTRVFWEGYGEREYAPMTQVDQVHVGSLSLSVAR